MSHAGLRISIGAALTVGVAAILLADIPLDRWLERPVDVCFWTFLTVVLLIGCREAIRMLRHKGYPCQPATSVIFVALMIAGAYVEINHPWGILPWLRDNGLELYLLLIVGLIFTAFAVEIIRIERAGNNIPRAIAAVGWTLLIVLTVGLLGVFLAKVRFLSADPVDGVLYLGLTLGTIKLSDIGAYAVGSFIGRHKLVPTLSPKKTVEGLAGALVFGTAGAMAIGCGWGRFTIIEMLLFGLAVSAAGVLGDLAESLIKRACEVKDSGPIPSFGGALDILDSMLAGAPVAYLLLVVLTGPLRMG
jgi:phosphatidate cytidylyltransferase